jgi:hypothetical protein
MTTAKFDETDRRKVIAEVEFHYQVKLAPVGSRRKFLRDQNGRTFWIFGGYEDWHGIPPEMMKAEEVYGDDGVLVIAKRHRNRIDIYCGVLKPLIQNKKSLSLSKKGDYQFNIRIRGNGLVLHEIQSLHLSKLGEATFTIEEKATEKAVTIIRKLSPSAREKLLEELSKRMNQNQ